MTVCGGVGLERDEYEYTTRTTQYAHPIYTQSQYITQKHTHNIYHTHTPNHTPNHTIIQVLRANDTMTKAGQLETAICRKLAGADPEGKRHCVRMLRHFEYRGHLCLVFEPLDMNLRELTKKYGRGVGLNVGAVRLYTAQLLQVC